MPAASNQHVSMRQIRNRVTLCTIRKPQLSDSMILYRCTRSIENVALLRPRALAEHNQCEDHPARLIARSELGKSVTRSRDGRKVQ